MELRHLRYFIVIAEELHFTHAAERLHISQPPLSQQIRDLEQEIGVELFARQGRRLDLTEAGRQFLKDARIVVELAERAKQSAQQFGKGQSGVVRVGFNTSVSFNPLVTKALSQYRAQHPGVQLVLSEKTTSILLGDLRNGLLDMAFVRPGPGETAGLRNKQLPEEVMMVALPLKHKLAEKARVRLSSLAAEPFVMYAPANGRAVYDAIVAACRKAGFNPNVVQEAPQISSTINWVASGVGVTIVPESMSHLQNHLVLYKTISGIAPCATMSLAVRSGAVSPAVDQFLAEVDRVFGKKQSPTVRKSNVRE